MNDDRADEPASPAGGDPAAAPHPDAPRPETPAAASGEARPVDTRPDEGPRAPTPSRHAAALLAVLLVVVLAGLVTSPWWAPEVAPLLPWGTTGDAASDAETRAALDRIGQRLAVIEQRPSGDAQPVLAKLDERLAAIDKRLAALEQRP